MDSSWIQGMENSGIQFTFSLSDKQNKTNKKLFVCVCVFCLFPLSFISLINQWVRTSFLRVVVICFFLANVAVPLFDVAVDKLSASVCDLVLFSVEHIAMQQYSDRAFLLLLFIVELLCGKIQIMWQCLPTCPSIMSCFSCHNFLWARPLNLCYGLNPLELSWVTRILTYHYFELRS